MAKMVRAARSDKPKRFGIKAIMSTIATTAISAGTVMATMGNPNITMEDRANMAEMLHTYKDATLGTVKDKATTILSKDPEKVEQAEKNLAFGAVIGDLNTQTLKLLGIPEEKYAEMLLDEEKFRQKGPQQELTEVETLLGRFDRVHKTQDRLTDNKKEMASIVKEVVFEIAGVSILALFSVPAAAVLTGCFGAYKLGMAGVERHELKQEQRVNDKEYTDVLIPFLQKMKALEEDLKSNVERFVELRLQSQKNNNVKAYMTELHSFIAEKIKEYGIDAILQVSKAENSVESQVKEQIEETVEAQAGDIVNGDVLLENMKNKKLEGKGMNKPEIAVEKGE